MAIQTNALGSGAVLEPAGFNFKPALSGASLGFTFGYMIRVPSSGMTDNGGYRFGIHDANADGGFNSGNEAPLVISADRADRGATRLRPGLASSTGSNQVSGTQTTPSYFTNAPQMVPGLGYLWLFGVCNIGTEIAPIWRIYVAGGQIGGTAVAQILPEGAGFASWLTTANPFYSQFFADIGSSIFRSPSGAAVENIGIVWHNIPWDAANNQPNLTVIQSLLDGASTYESASFRNGGTVKVWRKLANTADLVDYGADTRAAATIRGTLVDAAPIGTGLWLGASSITIAERFGGWVFGGRGTRTQSFSGAYEGAITGLQFRVERNTGTVASPVWALVSGFDWQSAGGSIGGRAWSFSLPGAGLPVGANYRLRVRSATDSAIEATTANRWHVGKVALLHGQSQMERAEFLGRGIRAPIANMAASVLRFAGSNQSAGSGAYEQPALDVSDLTSAAATGGGIMALANADWEATGEPTMYVDMTVEGTGLAAWNANDAYGNFFFRGNNASLPTAVGANGSGIMTMLALATERYRDVDLFNWGTADSGDTAGWPARMATYRGHLSSYFGNSSASAPMIIYPYPRSNGGATWPAPLNLRNAQRAYAQATPNTVLGPDILDIVMDSDGGNHPRATITDVGGFTREIAGEGSQRMGLTMGRGLARWGSSGTVSLGAPIMGAPVFTSASRDIIEIECGVALRTEAGATLAQLFAVSTDSGSTFGGTGFTASLVGTRVRLTKASGSWPSGTTRVDYCREMPFQSARENTEAAAVTLLNGLVYGPAQTWRDGRGMHLQPVGGTGLGVAESSALVPVAARVGIVANGGSAVITYRPVSVAAAIGLRAGTASVGGAAPLFPVAAQIGLVAGAAVAALRYTAAGVAARIGVNAGSVSAVFNEPALPVVVTVATFTAADLNAINKAIASGLTSVKYADGSSATYRSMEEMLRVREIIRAEVALAPSAPGANPRASLATFG